MSAAGDRTMQSTAAVLAGLFSNSTTWYWEPDFAKYLDFIDSLPEEDDPVGNITVTMLKAYQVQSFQLYWTKTKWTNRQKWVYETAAILNERSANVEGSRITEDLTCIHQLSPTAAFVQVNKRAKFWNCLNCVTSFARPSFNVENALGYLTGMLNSDDTSDEKYCQIGNSFQHGFNMISDMEGTHAKIYTKYFSHCHS